MGKKEVVPNRQYTLEFKLEAVRLAQSVGGNQAAKRLGIPDSSLWSWLRLSRSGRLGTGVAKSAEVKRSVSDLEAENARLRRELASAKLDLEIVKKAAVGSTRQRNASLPPNISAGV